ncbi:unnamed protein product [Rhizopus stolonifer]
MSHNPFGETNSNPWSEGGPKYGNAYESSSPPPALPPRIKETPTLVPSSPFGTQAMPSPSNYQPQSPANAWQQQESNKTLEEPTYNTNAYQYTGTAYGNSPTVTSAYSPQPIHTENITTTGYPNQKAESVITSSATKGRPSKLRALFRVILFIFAVGHLGFAAGASPYSGVSVPLDSSACFYFLFAVVKYLSLCLCVI